MGRAMPGMAVPLDLEGFPREKRRQRALCARILFFAEYKVIQSNLYVNAGHRGVGVGRETLVWREEAGRQVNKKQNCLQNV